MATSAPTLRPLTCWKSLLQLTRQPTAATRSLSTYRQPKPISAESPTRAPAPHVNRKIKVIAPPPAPASKEPIKDLTVSQINVLDPTGARTNLFSKTNREAAKAGDILLVRLKNGDPFAGVCISVRRRGVDTAILLRNQLTRVGVEMWYKIYSPNVEGIEVVERKAKRPRRARLTYMRKPKHDIGSVQNIVLQYQRSKSAIQNAAAGKELGHASKGGKRKVKGLKGKKK